MRARVTDLLHAHTELKLPSDIDTDMAAAAEDGEAAAAAAAVNRHFLARCTRAPDKIVVARRPKPEGTRLKRRAQGWTARMAVTTRRVVGM